LGIICVTLIAAVIPAHNLNARFCSLSIPIHNVISNTVIAIDITLSAMGFTTGRRIKYIAGENPGIIDKKTIMDINPGMLKIIPILDNIVIKPKIIYTVIIPMSIGLLLFLALAFDCSGGSPLETSYPHWKHFVPVFIRLSHFLQVIFFPP